MAFFWLLSGFFLASVELSHRLVLSAGDISHVTDLIATTRQQLQRLYKRTTSSDTFILLLSLELTPQFPLVY